MKRRVHENRDEVTTRIQAGKSKRCTIAIMEACHRLTNSGTNNPVKGFADVLWFICSLGMHPSDEEENGVTLLSEALSKAVSDMDSYMQMLMEVS